MSRPSTVTASCGHGARWSEDRKQFGHIVLRDEVEPELVCATCFKALIGNSNSNLKRVLIHGEWCEI
jgi:hypothetical protein